MYKEHIKVGFRQKTATPTTTGHHKVQSFTQFFNPRKVVNSALSIKCTFCTAQNTMPADLH